MDDLEFRRKVYADPHTNDESVLDAATNDPSKQQFIDELKHLDNKVQSTVHAVPVPDGLAHKLIFRQSIESHNQQRRRGRFHIALAASVAFVAGLTLTMMNNQEPEMSNFASIALGHVHHEADYAERANDEVTLPEVNAKLASFGGEIKDKFSRIYFANYCLFEKQKSLHLVLGDGDDKYTVFITPRDDAENFEPYFEDDQYIGRAWQTNEVNLVVISEKSRKYEKSMDSVRDKLLFSI